MDRTSVERIACQPSLKLGANYPWDHAPFEKRQSTAMTEPVDPSRPIKHDMGAP